jgi:hypothetical protein
MRVEAPIEGGKPIFRICFPLPNDNDQRVQQTILNYDAANVEGAATCIEGYMSYRDKRDVMLFPIIEGNMGPFPLSRWTLEENSSGKTCSRANTLKQIVSVLVVES